MREIRNLWEKREKTMIGRESTIQTDRATERLFRVSNERKRGNQKGEKDKQRNGNFEGKIVEKTVCKYNKIQNKRLQIEFYF